MPSGLRQQQTRQAVKYKYSECNSQVTRCGDRSLILFLTLCRKLPKPPWRFPKPSALDKDADSSQALAAAVSSPAPASHAGMACSSAGRFPLPPPDGGPSACGADHLAPSASRSSQAAPFVRPEHGPAGQQRKPGWCLSHTCEVFLSAPSGDGDYAEVPDSLKEGSSSHMHHEDTAASFSASAPMNVPTRATF